MREGENIGGAIFLAGWVNLTDAALDEEPNNREIAKPWLEQSINWEKVKSHCNQFTGIFSDDDPHVLLSDSKIFEAKLGAKTIIEHGKGHFSGSDGITELPSLLNAVLEISN
ncbi:MAG: Uncharacterized protein G01um101420_852 [Parcubacteria group bacterium Gr01-1014_20]|nr:MAG: Uncharacterized protein G01um101420_852 [Parcubacteria group bacterium Gr01-1014_20]